MFNTEVASLRKGLAVLVTAVALVGLAGCTPADTPPAETEGSLVLVHDQAAGDGSVIDSQIAGLQEVGDELGYETSDVYVADPANYESTLRNVADTGPTVIVTSFPRISDAFKAVAADYPDIKFVHIYADAAEPSLDNLLTVSYNYYEVMYLSGVFAASLTETGVIGWVGGDTQPMLAADYNAFAAGAQSIDPSIQVLSGIVGSFDDANKTQEVANQVFQSGADVIQGDANVDGLLAAVTQDPKRLFIGNTPTAFEVAPDQAFAIADFQFGPSVAESVKTVLEDGWVGGHQVTGIGGAIKLRFTDAPPTGELGDKYAAAKAAVEAAYDAVTSGSVKVPFVTELP